MNLPATDLWKEWLHHGRLAGDPAYAASVRERVAAYVTRLLDPVDLRPGMTLLDIGTGEGVVAWQAIALGGPALHVILSDVSAPLLAEASAEAERRGVAEQCRFVQASAERLEGIEDASVDVASARSVLAYVADKRAALRSLRRVLKPGGRMTLAEPVFQDDALEANLLRHRLATQPGAAEDIALRLMHRWKAAQFPDTLEAIAQSPIANYSERDLLRMALAEGFVDVRMTLDIQVATSQLRSWEHFLDLQPHPWAQSLRTVMEQHCTAAERPVLEDMLRPAIEGGRHITLDRMAYLSATRPEGP